MPSIYRAIDEIGVCHAFLIDEIHASDPEQVVIVKDAMTRLIVDISNMEKRAISDTTRITELSTKRNEFERLKKELDRVNGQRGRLEEQVSTQSTTIEILQSRIASLTQDLLDLRTAPSIVVPLRDETEYLD